MDTEPISMRARALVQTVKDVKPDVLMLQELTVHQSTHPSKSPFAIIARALCEPQSGAHQGDGGADEDVKYDVHVGKSWIDDCPYFTALYVRRNLFADGTVRSSSRIFPWTNMHRGIVCVEGVLSVNGAAIALVTSHLESLGESAELRQKQFQTIIDMQREFAKRNVTSIFGGDTNLRESEISRRDVSKTREDEEKRANSATATAAQRRKIETKLGDAWVMAGCDDDEKFTWDTMKNDNLQMDTARFKPRSRYDRVFLFGPSDSFPSVTSFRLLGKQRLASGTFISDHYGVLVDVEVNGP